MPKRDRKPPKLSVLMTMCLQNDFIERTPKMSREELNKKYSHKVHIGYEECERLWGSDGKLVNFIEDIMKINKNKSKNGYNYEFIHIRDWHDDIDPNQNEELEKFGPHCIKGTKGAKFISPLEEYIGKIRDINLVVNSNCLNSFEQTNLDRHLEALLKTSNCSTDETVIGIMGVITNIKILFLVYDLTIERKFSNVYICKDLCAAFDQSGHQQGLDMIEGILTGKVVDIATFKEKLNLIV